MPSDKPFSAEEAAAAFEALLGSLQSDPQDASVPHTPLNRAAPTDHSEVERATPDDPARATNDASAKKAPHFHAHRKRLVDKFDRRGAEAFDDYELLELLLFRTLPRIDTKPIAKDLIQRFGNLAEVVAAPVGQLNEVNGVGPATARDLKLLHQVSVRVGQKSVLNRPVLSSWSALLDYCRSAMQFETKEQFRVLFLDKKNCLMADEIVAKGTVDRAPVYPREIVRRALHHEATAVILVHNHPSGDPPPSPQDINLTETIVETLSGIDVVVHDHLIVGRQDVASFKLLGLI